MSLSNGNDLAMNGDATDAIIHSSHSESDLSEAQDPEAITEMSIDPLPDQNSMEDAVHDMATSESDEEEDAEGEDDADYNSESPPRDDDAMRQEESESDVSPRPGKRKAEDGDDYMQQNPELYGLRRSVRTRCRICCPMAC